MPVMKLENGYSVLWSDIENKGSSIIVDAQTNNIDTTLIYDESDHLIDDVVSADTNLAKDVKTGIAQTSGSWSDKAGMYDRTRSHAKAEKPHTKRVYKPKVYFWTKLLKGGVIVYCHSHKLCENDPVGKELYAEWSANPEKYMMTHPSLKR